ncbi:GAF domain-containing protein [Rhizomicrobium palustre]|uniref:GAF domain-containing protein n=1 Tax=Rhizomicrobium palustre TaxID=189966 RepID=A0A846MW52_9PROT|nr:GAF domain-containing protein [Rhizomicrobium palustre]
MSKAELYRKLEDEARVRAAGERNPIANAANFSALMFHFLPDINWAGFYFRKGRWLVLGPFMGKPACTRLQVGLGVCGTAVAQEKVIVVPDVHKFPGHVACDEASNSELVVPLHRFGTIVGVIDLDSPVLARFDEEDIKGVEALARYWVTASDDWS